jgi:hypothetical protein
MRISLNNIRDIERYVEGTMEQSEVVLFEERMRHDSLIKLNVILHEKVMVLIRMYHRRKLKMELEEVHNRLFNDPEKVMFRERVIGIFRNG